MSRRSLNETTGSTNPATKFLEWKSNDKCFAYYDREAKEQVKVQLPIKVQFLEHFHNVKGWNDASSSGIYSNEVKFISKEPLKVKAFKGGDIAEGLYSEIRGKIRDAGGKYYRSVYAVSDTGEIINLQFKGAVVSAYSDFMNENEGKCESSFIEINSFDKKKKGATEYTVPTFEIGAAFTAKQNELANDKYKDIASYFENYKAKTEIVLDGKSLEIDEDSISHLDF